MNTARMSVSFTRPQLEYLRVEAEQLGISIADMIRRIVDQHRGAGRPAPKPKPNKKETRRAG